MHYGFFDHSQELVGNIAIVVVELVFKLVDVEMVHSESLSLMPTQRCRRLANQKLLQRRHQ